LTQLAEPIVMPQELRNLAGRILDADSHEMMPIQEWTRHFGDEMQPFVDAWIDTGENDSNDIMHPYLRDYEGDTVPVGADLMKLKGARAPGATDIKRRLEVMDAMGVKQQLMFPTAILWPVMMMLDDTMFAQVAPDNRRATIKARIHRYNEWGIEAARISPRIRPVLPLIGDTPEEIIENARHLIDNGIRTLWLLSGMLPGGRSPAHTDLDPLWAMMAERKCVATLHLAAEGKFFETREWGNAPAFDGYRALTEVHTDPWSTSTWHLPSQNFLTVMVTGGVFERHPDLRFAVVEVGAWWIGPLMELLDLNYKQFSNTFPGAKAGDRLPHEPSYYMRKNVKVTPFYFEDIKMYFERHNLSDMLCFSTDYPHIEGGKNGFLDMYEKVKGFGPEVVEKFFVKNAEFLFPD